jgi:hypothetical protein
VVQILPVAPDRPTAKKVFKNYKYKIVVTLFGQQLQGTISGLHHKCFTTVNDNSK